MKTLQFSFLKSKSLTAIDKQKKNKISNQFLRNNVLKYYQFQWLAYKNLVIVLKVENNEMKNEFQAEDKLNIFNRIKNQEIQALRMSHF